MVYESVKSADPRFTFQVESPSTDILRQIFFDQQGFEMVQDQKKAKGAEDAFVQPLPNAFARKILP